MSLLFNTCLFLSLLFFQGASIFEFHDCGYCPKWFWRPRKWSLSLFPCFPIYLPWSDRTGYHDLRFWMLSFKSVFPLSSFTFTKRFFNSSSLSGIRVISSLYLRLLVVLPTLVIGISESGFWLVLHPIQHFTWCILHKSWISRWQYTALLYSFPSAEPVCYSMPA